VKFIPNGEQWKNQDQITIQNRSRTRTTSPYRKWKHITVPPENCNPATNHHSKTPPL